MIACRVNVYWNACFFHGLHYYDRCCGHFHVHSIACNEDRDVNRDFFLIQVSGGRVQNRNYDAAMEVAWKKSSGHRRSKRIDGPGYNSTYLHRAGNNNPNAARRLQ